MNSKEKSQFVSTKDPITFYLEDKLFIVYCIAVMIFGLEKIISGRKKNAHWIYPCYKIEEISLTIK